MSENEEGKVISGGLVVPMRPQVSIELTSDGEVVISTASISDNFRDVEHNEVCFPVECAREIADELYRLAGVAIPQDEEKKSVFE
ncbi:MAG TPA: hypothetical protein VL635_19115 [Trinickia sp.]|nr:hypothetical protein [Trinickia sp.]